jgi:enoyl-CoA hydratase/carnithine racemase
VIDVPTSSERVRAHTADGIGWLVLDRPDKHNAVSIDMFDAMAELMTTWEHDDAIRVVVVHGAGERAFASGADLGEIDRGVNGEASAGSRRATTLRISKPVIAMVHGYCIGGGLMVAMEADIRIASDDAVFGIPAGPLGAGYPFEAVQRLVALVGMATASTIMFAGERFDASTALRWGLVNEVLPRAELETRVRALASRLAANAPLSLAAAKASIAASVGLPGSSVEQAQALIDACWASDDFREGRTAFAEKRPPRFHGR